MLFARVNVSDREPLGHGLRVILICHQDLGPYLNIFFKGTLPFSFLHHQNQVILQKKEFLFVLVQIQVINGKLNMTKQVNNAFLLTVFFVEIFHFIQILSL